MLILHSCCAGCALPIIDHLIKNKNLEILLFFSNSNIFPFEEYQKRLGDILKIANYYRLKFIEDEYNHQQWLDYLKASLDKPLNSYPENSFRCQKCYEFRLLKTVEFLKKNNFKDFATTLSVNLYKDIDYINQFALKLSKENNLNYIKIDLLPGVAKRESLRLSKELNIYRQKYCGCEFSLNNNF
ncbi:MAG: epoxyqueuosine reductase QueH [Minisyncoccia bacterium]